MLFLASLFVALCLTVGVFSADLLMVDTLKAEEYVQAMAAGFTIDVVNTAGFNSMTTAQFSAYRAIVIGDPYCGSIDEIAFLETNKDVWSSAVTGNIVLIGTDPSYHASCCNIVGARNLMTNSINFAAGQNGTTGLYMALSCYGVQTPITALSYFGTFNMDGPPSADVHIVASSPALGSLSDDDISNWYFSVHEMFTAYPSSGGNPFLPLAVVTGATGPGSMTFGDGSSGVPYILARGATPAGCGDGIWQPALGEESIDYYGILNYRLINCYRALDDRFIYCHRLVDYRLVDYIVDYRLVDYIVDCHRFINYGYRLINCHRFVDYRLIYCHRLVNYRLVDYIVDCHRFINYRYRLINCHRFVDYRLINCYRLVDYRLVDYIVDYRLVDYIVNCHRFINYGLNNYHRLINYIVDYRLVHYIVNCHRYVDYRLVNCHRFINYGLINCHRLVDYIVDYRLVDYIVNCHRYVDYRLVNCHRFIYYRLVDCHRFIYYRLHAGYGISTIDIYITVNYGIFSYSNFIFHSAIYRCYQLNNLYSIIQQHNFGNINLQH
ncbi:hypothetical protein diail_7428 [Diaporthe ilicicola]|nr:hypothetical protein diail_7428 [Diaporthe ilicicola]